MPFTLLEDVALADLAVEVRAKSISELFQESAIAIQSLQFDLSRITPSIEKEVRLEGYADLKELLYSFLCEIIFYKDAEAVALSTFEVNVEEINGNFNLRARLFGEKIDPAKHSLHADIKAITRHLFELTQEQEDAWRAVIVVDV